MNTRSNYIIPDGTEQAQRFPRALESGYFQPDERRLEKTLALGFEIARTFSFFDLNDKPKGTWGDLFTANDAVIIAHILSSDPDRLKSEFAKHCDRGFEHSVKFAFETAQTIDLWLTRLGASRSRVGIELSGRIQPLLSEGLSKDLRLLAQIIARLRPLIASLEKLSFDDFHRSWGIHQTAEDSLAPARIPPQPLRDDIRAIVATQLNIVTHLHSLVRPYLAESLKSQQHEPAIALFMVFLKLFERANDQLNRFTERHLDFYYKQVLGARSLQQRPDHLYFSLRPTEGRSEVPFAAGSELVTQSNEGGGDIVFVSEQETLISDARVDSLCTLRFERDRFISPETELGYVTRIKSLERDQNAIEEADAALSDWPVFGTSSRLAGHKSAQDARIGFAVASPLLLLGEGRRSIDIQVEYSDPEEPAEQEICDLFRAELGALLSTPGGNEPAFHRLLGRIFRHYILTAAGESMRTELLQELHEGARQLLAPHAQIAVEQLLRLDPEAIFQRLLKDVFDISLTTPAGWFPVDRIVMTRLGCNPAHNRSGLRFRFTLGPEVAPIVAYAAEIHGGQLRGASPLIRFQLNPQASFCAYSLFDTLRLEAVNIDVQVQGLRNLKLYNNIGKIDPAKPFQPFGPMPALSSYLVLGSYEIAQKRLTDLTLNLVWADLPTSFGGFAAHYAGYQQTPVENDIRVKISVLQDGIWRPELERQQPTACLFQPTGPTDQLKSSQSISIKALDFFRQTDATADEEQFDLQKGVRNGFFRLGLCGPEAAFGHTEYPPLLAQALAQKIRLKKSFTKVPNAPYTPLIADISMSYTAHTKISIDESGRAKPAQPKQRIFHLHPFGHEEIRPIQAGNPYALLPRYDTDGNLFLGISGGRAGQPLSLLFDLNEETNQQTALQSPNISWHYLSAQGWQPMPAMNLVLDTTNGFICSGIVTLILPEELDRQSSLMPAGKAWIRVGANECLDALPRLRSVRANVVRASRRSDAATGEMQIDPLSADNSWRTTGPVPGIAEVVQLGEPGGGSPKENRRRFLTRISERLCHKSRAINLWDYERLILERFPNLFKVKCFDGLVPAEFNPEEAEPKPRPGQILIVVVPAVGEGENLAYRRPMLDVPQLNNIRQYIQQIASPFAEIEVRNPLYERIQVRCKASFADPTNSGFYIRKLNADLADFLCPWIQFGYQARFGWTISREEIEGFIRNRDYVEYVTDFSMLHISEDDEDLYTLADTVSRNSQAEQSGLPNHANESTLRHSNQVRWRYPWSLAVPMEQHFIEALRKIEPMEPQPAGVGELDIGGTFIISGIH